MLQVPCRHTNEYLRQQLSHHWYNCYNDLHQCIQRIQRGILDILRLINNIYLHIYNFHHLQQNDAQHHINIYYLSAQNVQQHYIHRKHHHSSIQHILCHKISMFLQKHMFLSYICILFHFVRIILYIQCKWLHHIFYNQYDNLHKCLHLGKIHRHKHKEHLIYGNLHHSYYK